MTHMPGEAALIDSALAAIGMVLARMDGAPLSLPTDAPRPTAASLPVPMAPIPLQTTPVLMSDFPAEYRAIHSCLVSASALLGVSQTLIRQPASPTPMERVRQWDDVISQTKTAGRAAYQAALMLTDKHVD